MHKIDEIAKILPEGRIFAINTTIITTLRVPTAIKAIYDRKRAFFIYMYTTPFSQMTTKTQ